MIQGGRGSGKTRAGAETLADMIHEYPGMDWAIVAPTYGDARDTCVEGPSGIRNVLGPLIEPPEKGGWNRSMGILKLRTGGRIFLDGADDGAYRIQGKNLAGAWCDEIGLWRSWETAWNESLAFAIRFEPGKIVATGTPKMGHGLVRMLLEDERTIVSRMRTTDNVANLSAAAVEELIRQYEGTRLGKQELDGEWIAEIEGDLLMRSWWRYYHPRRNEETDQQFVARLPKFSMVVCSWDTPLKDKEASDFVAGQCWGVYQGQRWLLDSRKDRMGFAATKRAATEMYENAVALWPNAAQYVLIENAGYGVELIEELRGEIGGVQKINPGAEGSKGMRAFSASPDLESGNCFLPGFPADDLSGPDERRSPSSTTDLVNEAASFKLDGSHTTHDDQVDAWSQAMNWLRRRGSSEMRVYVPTGTI